MTCQQFHTVQRLVHECCNNVDGNCPLLDNGWETRVCVQSISRSLVCKYSRADVLPLDRDLETALKAVGVEVKRGKHLAFNIPGGKRLVRCSSLGEDYTEDAILERISGKRIVAPKQKQAAPNPLIDIQAKLQQAHSPGFERWASVFNLKEMAKTLNFLQEHGLTAYADLKSACNAAAQKYHDLADRTKANSDRMKEISELQKHIGAYHKTHEIYAQYRRLPPKKQGDFSLNTPAPSSPARRRNGSLTAWD